MTSSLVGSEMCIRDRVCFLRAPCRLQPVEGHLRRKKKHSPRAARATGQPCCLVAAGPPSSDSRAAHEAAHCLR
eukprot:6077360-Prorocentrum_lima.AAC.1